jgi:hypothetical protein
MARLVFGEMIRNWPEYKALMARLGLESLPQDRSVIVSFPVDDVVWYEMEGIKKLVEVPLSPSGSSAWIKCSDRLPDKDGPVLVYAPRLSEADIDDPTIQVMWFWPEKERGFMLGAQGVPNKDVTHWMPIPEPPA